MVIASADGLPPAALSRHAVDRLVRSLLADELGRQRHRPMTAEMFLAWPADQSFADDGLALDSLERLNLATRLNQFFHLFEAGIEDYLLAENRLAGWIDLVCEGQKDFSGAFTFLTSGSTGEPKRCTHARHALERETAFWAAMVNDCKRVVSMVPCHHIYGFLWTVLLPEHKRCEVVDGRLFKGSWRRHLRPGDLVVAVPSQWHYAAESLAGLPDLAGVSATSPLEPSVAARLRQDCLSTLIEVFGASDLGGIGWRQETTAPFKLLPCWRQAACSNQLSWQAPDLPALWHDKHLADHLEFIDECRFLPRGRIDRAVQIGGHNVYPEKIARLIETCPKVAACVVRLHEQDQLKAFIVPANISEIETDETGINALEQEINEWCRQSLPPQERPRSLTFGQVVPTDSLGKPADWQPTLSILTA